MAFGRMARQPDPAPIAEINITPLVDVMLVLVVIFILAAPLLATAIRLDLPRTEGAAPLNPSPAITLLIDATGQVFWDDQPLSLLALEARLQDVGQDAPDTEVQLRADAQVPYGKVVEVMGAAHQAGLHRIGFVAQPVTAGMPEGQR